jgi:hypothetical protein
MLAAQRRQQVAVELVIGAGKEHRAAPVAALGSRDGQSGNDEAGDAGHGEKPGGRGERKTARVERLGGGE